jgi:hypothetical protein
MLANSIVLPSTRFLCDAMLVSGFVGGISCLALHKTGCGDPSVPISVEYTNCNPLAITFLWSTVVMSALTSVLYWRVPNRTESILMACTTLCLGIIAFTLHTSTVHGLALVLAFLSISLTTIVNAIRGEIGLGSIVRLSTVASMFILAFITAIPGSPISFGIAERFWFVVAYVNIAWNLNIVRQEP